MKTKRASRRWLRWAKALALGTATVLVLLLAAHFTIASLARLTPPATHLPPKSDEVTTGTTRRVGASTAERRGRIWVIHLSGSPDAIGWSHARLMRDEMIRNEGILLTELGRTVRPAPARWLLLDLAQLRYRKVDTGMSEARRREIAAEALGFAPDPYRHVFPTYQRFVYLNALYDIALSFEKSPLIGCTTFTFSRAGAEAGHTLLARAFDFDVNDVFDEQKAVFFVREDGAIPFASVAWPGLVGVVSGMNLEGLAVVVHGGRAGQPRAVGEPVVHGLRRVLSRARTVDEAVRILAEHPPMVSHIVIAADATGATAAIERVPGSPPWVRRLGDKAVVTNHFMGPAASDPKNQQVRLHTSTLAREARGKELLAALDHPATVETAVRLLRDRKGVGNEPLPLGDRRAIDALIATHGVVFDATSRRMWVSESPHLLGRFVAFDLKHELGDEAKPRPASDVPADPLYTSGRYARFASRR